jgi:type IV pilus assembly protein PilE
MKPSYNKIRGFTLIELMVTMVIVGVLMAVAIPGYKRSVQKSHRSQAEQLMQAIASKEAEFLLDARFYSKIPGTGTGAVTIGGVGDTGLRLTNASNQTNGSSPFTCAANSSTCSNAFYTLVLTPVNTAGAPPTFSITATAISQQLGDGNLTLDYLGNKTRKIPPGTSDQGW